MYYREHWRRTFDSINALQAFYRMPKLSLDETFFPVLYSGPIWIQTVCRERERERERETVYVHPFGKIKVTNASADRQGELFFKLSHSLIQAPLELFSSK